MKHHVNKSRCNMEVSETDTDLEGPFELLPPEILENIFVQYTLSEKDVFNISLTCRRFREICCSNELWKQKSKRRYWYM